MLGRDCTSNCPELTVQLGPHVSLTSPGLQGSPPATGPSAAASGAGLVLQAGAAQQAASLEGKGPMQRFLGSLGRQATGQARARWADAASRARGACSPRAGTLRAAVEEVAD